MNAAQLLSFAVPTPEPAGGPADPQAGGPAGQPASSPAEFATVMADAMDGKAEGGKAEGGKAESGPAGQPACSLASAEHTMSEVGSPKSAFGSKHSGSWLLTTDFTPILVDETGESLPEVPSAEAEAGSQESEVGLQDSDSRPLTPADATNLPLDVLQSCQACFSAVVVPPPLSPLVTPPPTVSAGEQRSGGAGVESGNPKGEKAENGVSRFPSFPLSALPPALPLAADLPPAVNLPGTTPPHPVPPPMRPGAGELGSEGAGVESGKLKSEKAENGVSRFPSFPLSALPPSPPPPSSPVPSIPALSELPAAATILPPTAPTLVPSAVAGLDARPRPAEFAPISSGTSLAVIEVTSDPMGEELRVTSDETGSSPGTRHSSLLTASAPVPQLPGAVAASENVAQSVTSAPLASAALEQGVVSSEASASKGLPGLPVPPEGGREPRGTSAAKSKGTMKQVAIAEQTGAGTEAGRSETAWDEPHSGGPRPAREIAPLNFPARTLDATEWPPGRSVQSTDRSAPEISAARAPETNRAVEQISGLLLREAGLLRQHSPDSMAVVLRPDANTELMVHLTQRNGQIEASVRCERGDFQQLGALWGHLQESLAGQKIQLAPLQESSGSPSGWSSSPAASGDGQAGAQWGRGGREPAAESAAEQARQSARPQPRSPAEPMPQNPSLRLQTGWETWA